MPPRFAAAPLARSKAASTVLAPGLPICSRSTALTISGRTVPPARFSPAAAAASNYGIPPLLAMPPSIVTMVPLVYDDKSDARKTTVAAISSHVARGALAADRAGESHQAGIADGAGDIGRVEPLAAKPDDVDDDAALTFF